MQQMLIDVTKEPFPKLMQEVVFGPIGMTHSTYEQPLPADMQPAAATPYGAKQHPIPEGPTISPEWAPPGCRTPAPAWARNGIEINRSLSVRPNRALAQDCPRQMLTLVQ